MATEINDSGLVNYTQEGHKLNLVINAVCTYAFINALMHPDNNGLDFTGKYLIYLLHPEIGSTQFTMEFDSQLYKWISREVDPRIDHAIIQKISESIDSRRM